MDRPTRQEDVAKELRARNGLTLRTKLRASAYTSGGPNYRKLFRFLDLDNSGVIEAGEFLQLCRKSGKVARGDGVGRCSDSELLDVFHHDVDADGNGAVSVDEFIAWIKRDGAASASTAGRRESGARAVDGGDDDDVDASFAPVWPHSLDEKLFILQPPMHFANRSSPQRVMREGGRKLDDGARGKLAVYLGSSIAEQKEWERRGMPASPSPVKQGRRRQRPPSPAPSPSRYATFSSANSSSSSSSRVQPPLRPRDLTAAATPTASSPLAEKLLSMTHGLAERVASASRGGSSSNALGNANPPARPSPEKKRVLDKLAFLIERFNQVATISTSLEQRVYDLTDYCHELEGALVQHEEKQRAAEALRAENDSLRRSLCEVQARLDAKYDDFGTVSDVASGLVARIDQGETLLASMHGKIQQLALKLRQEHKMRCDAEAMVLSMEKSVRSANRRSRRGSAQRIDVAHQSADEADDVTLLSSSSSSPLGAHNRQGSTTPLAQYQGAFESMNHFEGYLEKLRSKRLEREQQRVVQREKRKSSAGTAAISTDAQQSKRKAAAVLRARAVGTDARPFDMARTSETEARQGAKAIPDVYDEDYGGMSKRLRPAATASAATAAAAAVREKSSATYSVREEPAMPTIKSHVVSIAQRPVSGGARTGAAKRLHDDKASHESSSVREKSGSPDPVLPQLENLPSPTPVWSGLDSLEELRDIHEAGQDILSKLSTLNSGSKSVGSAERRRAGRDAARLEDHVDQLTQQYHDLLAAANDECGIKRLVDDEAASESEVTAVGSQEIEGDASAKSKSPKKKKK